MGVLLTSVMSDKAVIRWAEVHEGPVVRSILQNQGVTLAYQVDWTRPLAPYWLLYCAPLPIGCINVNPGQPVGRLEWLTVRKDVAKRVYACAIRDLCYAGMSALKQGGSQVVAGYVNDQDVSWKKVIERRGLVPVEHGTLYMRRL